jgi:hypothetical protein
LQRPGKIHGRCIRFGPGGPLGDNGGEQSRSLEGYPVEEEIFIPITIFASVVLIVWIFQHFALRKRVEAFTTLRFAIEKGQVITPAAMEAMSRFRHPRADLRTGIVCIALAAAFGALSYVLGSEEPDVIRPILGVGVFPLFLGLAFIGLHIFASDRTDA